MPSAARDAVPCLPGDIGEGTNEGDVKDDGEEAEPAEAAEAAQEDERGGCVERASSRDALDGAQVATDRQGVVGECCEVVGVNPEDDSGRAELDCAEDPLQAFEGDAGFQAHIMEWSEVSRYVRNEDPRGIRSDDDMIEDGYIFCAHVYSSNCLIMQGGFVGKSDGGMRNGLLKRLLLPTHVRSRERASSPFTPHPVNVAQACVVWASVDIIITYNGVHPTKTTISPPPP